MGEKIVIPGDVETEFEILGETEFNVRRTQDVSGILELNKAFRDSGLDGFNEGRDMKHVASIPVIMLELWATEAGIPKNECMGPKMNEIIRQKLNNPDNEFLRTGKGRI